MVGGGEGLGLMKSEKNCFFFFWLQIVFDFEQCVHKQFRVCKMHVVQLTLSRREESDDTRR